MQNFFIETGRVGVHRTYFFEYLNTFEWTMRCIKISPRFKFYQKWNHCILKMNLKIFTYYCGLSISHYFHLKYAKCVINYYLWSYISIYCKHKINLDKMLNKCIGSIKNGPHNTKLIFVVVLWGTNLLHTYPMWFVSLFTPILLIQFHFTPGTKTTTPLRTRLVCVL